MLSSYLSMSKEERKDLKLPSRDIHIHMGYNYNSPLPLALPKRGRES